MFVVTDSILEIWGTQHQKLGEIIQQLGSFYSDSRISNCIYLVDWNSDSRFEIRNFLIRIDEQLLNPYGVTCICMQIAILQQRVYVSECVCVCVCVCVYK